MMAQSGNIKELSIWILITCLLLLAGIVILGLGVWYYRRRWLGSDETAGTPWTLEDLRRLRDQGDLSEEEYETMRAAMISALGAGSSKPDPASTPADADDSGRQ